jgi:RimK family alpha-L-glutamate ligase
MRIVILSARGGWHTNELVRAFGERGHIAVVLPYEGLVARNGATGSLTSAATPILDADIVMARIIPSGSLDQIIYRVDALHWLEARGVCVINSPRAIERCVDKFYTTALLDTAGLPVPETVTCQSLEDAMPVLREWQRAIIKPLFGSMGHGMVRVEDPETGFRVLRSLDQIRAVFHLQRVVEHDGYDVRVLVAKGDVLGAIQRYAPPGEWRTNIALGGTATPVVPKDEWRRLALHACDVVGADYAGVDLLPSRNGRTFVLEINAIPAWQGLQQATGLDVAALLADRLLPDRVPSQRAETS